MGRFGVLLLNEPLSKSVHLTEAGTEECENKLEDWGW